MPLRSRPLGALDDHLGYWLRFVGADAAHALRRGVAKFGVTDSDWVVLRELYRLGPCSPRWLAIQLGITESAMSRMMERLDDQGLIERSRVPRGMRQWELKLSMLGRALVPVLEWIAQENDAEFFGHLTRAERTQLTTMLKGVALRRRRKAPPVEP